MKKAPNLFKARSLVKSAETEMNFISTILKQTGAEITITRGVYENFRMLGEALLFASGFVPEKDLHNQMINKLIELKVATRRPLILLRDLKLLRHRVNYDGHIPTLSEIELVRELKKELWNQVLDSVKNEVENKKA